jgi:hypothetical protein
MDPSSLANSPFSALTFIVAPAILTNACSVLAMSTINRMLKTRDRMYELFAESEAGGKTPEDSDRIMEQVNRVEKQAILLLHALHAIYIALGAFAGATLVTLLGAVLAPLHGDIWMSASSALGIILGAVGVGGLIYGCTKLLAATRLSLLNLRQEAALIRNRHGKKSEGSLTG